VHCPIGHPCAQKLSPDRVLAHVSARLSSLRRSREPSPLRPPVESDDARTPPPSA
jgi:hypothetical protein